MNKLRQPFLLVLLLLTLLIGVAWQHIRLNAEPDVLDVMNQAVQAHAFPGACVVVGTRENILFKECAGFHTYEKQVKDQTSDLFDLASLTKVVATTPTLMRLVDEHKIDINQPVQHYLPEFEGPDKSKITIRQLLTHTSGLPPENYTNSWEKLYATKLKNTPGTVEQYSDVNFVLLGKVIEKVTDKSLADAANDLVFNPLDMQATQYNPIDTNIVPTTPNAKLGVVHDPQARLLNGVAGNAGVFSSVDDLANYAQVLLNNGYYKGQKIFQDKTMALFTQQVAENSTRALGWDTAINPYDEKKQFQFSAGLNIDPDAFGHTGFTGTSMWISPKQNLYMVLLTNRVFEQSGDQKIDRYWRQKIASTVWQQYGYANNNGLYQEHERLYVEQGIDRITQDQYAKLLSGKRVAVVANRASASRWGENIIDVLQKMPNVTLVKIFTPEHGFSVTTDDKIKDTNEHDIPVLSLYGPRKAPSKEELSDVDVIVYDIQDVGLRYYTYASTLGHLLRAVKESNKQLVVLDRVNPLGGDVVAGPILDKRYKQYFTSYHQIPMRYGLTIGELAKYDNKFNHVNAQLTVVPLKNWRREVLFGDTDLVWHAPSPALPSFQQAMLYNTFGAFETLPLSVGRSQNNHTAFRQYGAPWISVDDAKNLVEKLNALQLPGLFFSTASWKPDRAIYSGKTCNGFLVNMSSVDDIKPFVSLIKVAQVLHQQFPEKINLSLMENMIGAKSIIKLIAEGATADDITKSALESDEEYMDQRKKILLY